MKKKLLAFLKWFLIIFTALNLLIVVTGHSYLYKGIANTYLKGRMGPDTDEFRIFHNRISEIGTPEKWNLASSYNKKQLASEYLNYFDQYETLAFLVIKDDSLINENYYRGFTDTSLSNGFSMAKTFVSILTGVALKENKIKSIDQSITDFIPEFNIENNKQITFRHLLTMSSGIDFDEDYVNPFAYPAKAYYGTNLKELTLSYQAKDKPGMVFNYLSGNTFLLGLALERATGKNIATYFSEKLWKPMGAEKHALWSLDRENGNEKAYCCFIATAKDFARFGKLYLDSGRWNNNTLVPESYVYESVTPAKIKREDGSVNSLYGFSWWLLPNYKGNNIFYARGILGQYIIVVPEKNMIVVRLGKKREKVGDEDHPRDVFKYIDAALSIL